MDKEKSWSRITELGNYMRRIWKKNAKKYDINITINGLVPVSTYYFNHKDNLKFKTYLSQEFLKNGFLASTNFYSSIAHNERILDNYSDILDEIYSVINDCIKGNKRIDNLLNNQVCHSGFKRLN